MLGLGIHIKNEYCACENICARESSRHAMYLGGYFEFDQKIVCVFREMARGVNYDTYIIPTVLRREN